MNCSPPGLPVHHQLPEFTQTHAHQVGGAIQPHLWSSPSPPALNPSQLQSLFQWVTFCMRWSKYWSFSFSISPSNKHPGLISFRMDWLDSKQSLPTKQEKTLHMDITRWSTTKSDWLYSLQPKMEKLYTVSKNKTRSWLWLRSWTPYCQIQT